VSRELDGNEVERKVVGDTAPRSLGEGIVARLVVLGESLNEAKISVSLKRDDDREAVVGKAFKSFGRGVVIRLVV